MPIYPRPVPCVIPDPAPRWRITAANTVQMAANLAVLPFACVVAAVRWCAAWAVALYATVVLFLLIVRAQDEEFAAFEDILED